MEEIEITACSILDYFIPGIDIDISTSAEEEVLVYTNNTEELVLSKNEIEPQYPGTIVKLPIATTQEGFEESWTMNGEVVKNSFTMPKCDVVLEVTQKSKPHKVKIDNPDKL